MTDCGTRGRWALLVLTGVLFAGPTGCVTTHLYAHRTLEGSFIPADRLDLIHEGLPAEQVRELLGEPLTVETATGGEMWRYFERAQPRWCDGGSRRANAPEYTLEVLLYIRAGAVETKKVVRTDG